MAKVLKYHIIILCILFCSINAVAQPSLDIGISLSTMPGNTVSSLITDFNKSLPSGTKPMRRMNVTPGLIAGFTYRLDPVIFIAEYEGLFSSVVAKRLKNSADENYNYILNISRNAAGAGVGSKLGYRLSLGIIGSYNWYTSYQFLSSDTKNKERMFRKELFGIKPFIDVIVGKQAYIDVSLRAFYFHALSTVRIDKLANALDPDNSSGLTNDELNFRPSNFGLAFIFRNKR